MQIPNPFKINIAVAFKFKLCFFNKAIKLLFGFKIIDYYRLGNVINKQNIVRKQFVIEGNFF